MTTKRNNTTHNEVVVERVLTSDAFLTREIKKAPMKTTGDSLIADLTHLPNDLKITIQGAREHNLKNVDLEFRAIAWWCSPDCRVLANPRSPSIRYSPKANADMWSRCRRTQGSSWGKWTSPTSISSKV